MDNKPMKRRQLPHSVEAERALLSSVMQLPFKWLDEFGDRLAPEHFYVPAHATIYSALLRMRDAKKTIDLFTLTDFLRDDGHLETIGGPGYLTETYDFVPAAAAADHYFDTVKRKWLRRRIILTGSELVQQCQEPPGEDRVGDEENLLDVAQAAITALALESIRVDVIRHGAKGAETVAEDIEHTFKRRGQVATLGYESGFLDLDRQTGGIQKQQLIIVGARPSQGKTAILVNMAAHMAVQKHIPVLFFTMEMSYTQLCRRFAACVAGLNLQHFRDGFFAHRNTFPAFIEKTRSDLEPLKRAPIWIDESPAVTIGAFKARCRRAAVQYGIKAVFVDYVGLMKTGSNKKDMPRWLEVTEISQALKATAKELDLPVIAAAQLNREPEGRKFGKPQMGDLRDSGSLEQDADVLLLLWRPVKHIEKTEDRDKLARGLNLTWHDDDALYKTKSKDELTAEEIEERDRQLAEFAELGLEKQRDGSTNPIRLRFIGEEMKFYNVTTKGYSSREEERQQNVEEV